MALLSLACNSSAMATGKVVSIWWWRDNPRAELTCDLMPVLIEQLHKLRHRAAQQRRDKAHPSDRKTDRDHRYAPRAEVIKRQPLQPARRIDQAVPAPPHRNSAALISQLRFR
jgi:hypothetical protein